MMNDVWCFKLLIAGIPNISSPQKSCDHNLNHNLVIICLQPTKTPVELDKYSTSITHYQLLVNLIKTQSLEFEFSVWDLKIE